jgi:Holliday junction DNA helicase RuvA
VIGYLRGRIVENTEETLTLDVNGVGYELTCSTNTLSDLLDLSAAQGKGDARGDARGEIKVWVHTHVREDALTLFGFSTPLEKKVFNSLLQVNGVGPKMATKILSGASLAHLINMIDHGDAKGLSGLPKVGKKTAEQLILTLKGKLVIIEEEPSGSKLKNAKATSVAKVGQVRSDLMSALINLGFRPQDVEKVVCDFPADIDMQQGLRQGLQALTGQV